MITRPWKKKEFSIRSSAAIVFLASKRIQNRKKKKTSNNQTINGSPKCDCENTTRTHTAAAFNFDNLVGVLSSVQPNFSIDQSKTQTNDSKSMENPFGAFPKFLSPVSNIFHGWKNDFEIEWGEKEKGKSHASQTEPEYVSLYLPSRRCWPR